MRSRTISSLALAAGAVALAAGCSGGTKHHVVPGGDAGQGKTLIEHYGCGSCHVIGGVTGANGVAGPELEQLPKLTLIAGKLPNETPNLIRWIMHPQQVTPGVDMPDLGVTKAQARDIAAYLYEKQ